ANGGEELRRVLSSTPHGYVVKPFGRGQLEAAVELGLLRWRSERTRKEREKWLELMAYEDPLTGLMNRRAFDDHATRYLALAKRRRTLLGLIYLDLVGFKAINDGFGHEAGDEVLAAVARRLEAGARGSDLVCRMGGDEFVVLLPDVDGWSAAMEVAHRLDRELREPITAAGSSLKVRADMGVALYPADGSSVDALLRSADRSLYDAKGGRVGSGVAGS
ncbi:MAG TPA: diguanylate cyclase, partial [Longimicrobiales bacterium]|nr:diguanylate cyclase [Longimicrobiales bacterium]